MAATATKPILCNCSPAVGMFSGIQHYQPSLHCHRKGPCTTFLSKPLVCLIAAILLLGSSGCASRHGLSPTSQARKSGFGTVGVLPANFIPDYDLSPFYTKNGFSGIGIGVADGMARGFLAALQAGPPPCSGRDCHYVLAGFFIAGPLIGGIAGGISGAINGPPTARNLAVRTAISSTLEELKIQDTMARYVSQHGNEMTDYRFYILEDEGPTPRKSAKPDYALLGRRGIDTALEVMVNSLRFEGDGGAGTLAFTMTVSVRLTRVRNGREVYFKTFRYRGQVRSQMVWLPYYMELMREDFEQAYIYLARKAVEEAFLVVDIPQAHWSTRAYCMLQPLYPEYEYGFFPLQGKHAVVDSLQPTLRWEAFPRSKDGEDKKTGFAGRVSDVSYDLEIREAEDGRPGKSVYVRHGLPYPYHELEFPLKPQSTYFWTVRARFLLDDRRHVTRWSYSRWPVNPVAPDILTCTLDHVPESNYYRFRTPPEGITP